VKGGRKEERGDLCVFLFKQAERPERVEPAAISGASGRGSRGNGMALAERTLPAQWYLEAFI